MSNGNERKEDSSQEVGRMVAEMLKADDGVVVAAQCSFLSSPAREELRTSAHGALKHLKHDASRPGVVDLRASGGLAALSLHSRSTT